MVAIDLQSGIEACLAGVGLAVFYCALLWLAVRRLGTSSRPIAWLAATALPRLGVPLAGFYWIMEGGWQRLLACLAGFVLTRLAIQQWMRVTGPREADYSGQEGP